MYDETNKENIKYWWYLKGKNIRELFK
jgi:hypothetical protein